MSTSVPTDRRASVRLLLRIPATPGATAQRKIGGYLVIILAEAKPSDWPSTEVQPGDLEAIVWTTPRQVLNVVENLRKCEGVIDARGIDDDLDA